MRRQSPGRHAGCGAGFRRSWAPGAIGNAEWTGVRLADVLRAAGIDADDGATSPSRATTGSRTRTRASAPQSRSPRRWPRDAACLRDERRASRPRARPSLARGWCRDLPASAARNGSPASRCRTGPPTTDAGRRLQAVSARRDGRDRRPAHGITIEAMPLNSAICEPARGAALKAGRHAIRGYAIASDRAVARVDVSTDGGRSWRRPGSSAMPTRPTPGRSGRSSAS